MTQRDGAAMRIHVFGVIGQSQLPHHRDALACESLIQLDDVDVTDAHAHVGEQLLHRRRRADAHDARWDPGRDHGHDARARRQAVALSPFFGGDQQRRGAVVHARGVAGRHRAGIAERGLQLGQHFQRGVVPGMLIDRHHRVALAAFNRDRHDLAGEETAVLRLLVPHLAAIRERILIRSADLEFLRHVLPGFRHRVGAVHLFHLRVHETPADGGVVNFAGARERLGRLAHHERRAGHALDAASKHKLRIPAANRPSCGTNGVEAGAAEPVDRRTRHGGGETSQQHRHAGDVAIVFAGLVGAAHDAIVQRIPVDTGMPFLQRPDGMGGEVVGADVAQRPGIAADRGAGEVADIGFGHNGFLPGQCRSRLDRRRMRAV